MGCGGSAVMDLEPIEERANEFATWVGKFDSEHRIPAAFASAADVPALVEEVNRLRAEVARLEEDLSDRTMDLAEMTHPDRPAPAWDEDAVRAEVDREALRRFVDSFCDDEAGEVEHVVSVDRTSGFALTGGNDAHAVLCKAASALWPGESRATVQAEALREARDAVRASSFWADGSDNYADRVRGYLSARADRLAAEGGDDRG